MSTERWFNVMVEVTEENDGWTFLRKGPEARSKVLSLDEALRTYGSARIRQVLAEALAKLPAPSSGLHDSPRGT